MTAGEQMDAERFEEWLSEFERVTMIPVDRAPNSNLYWALHVAFLRGKLYGLELRGCCVEAA